MTKKLFLIAAILIIVMSVNIPVLAEAGNDFSSLQVSSTTNDKVIYEDTVTVTPDGGTYEVGFVTVTFKKNFIDSSSLPINITISVYAEDGEAVIEFSPDVDDFNKKVKVKAEKFEGFLYDAATGMNEWITVKNQTMQLSHFSRYAFS